MYEMSYPFYIYRSLFGAPTISKRLGMLSRGHLPAYQISKEMSSIPRFALNLKLYFVTAN